MRKSRIPTSRATDSGHTRSIVTTHTTSHDDEYDFVHETDAVFLDVGQ